MTSVFNYFSFYFFLNIILCHLLTSIYCIDSETTVSLDFQGNIQQLGGPGKGVIHSSSALPLVSDDLGKLLILAVYSGGLLDKYILSGSYYYRSTHNDTRIMLYATNRRYICVFGALKRAHFLIESTNGDAVVTHGDFTFLFNTLTLKSSGKSPESRFWHYFFYDCYLTDELRRVRSISDKEVQSWHIVTPPSSWNYISSTIYPKNIKVEKIKSLFTEYNEEFLIKDFSGGEPSVQISLNNRPQGIIFTSSNLFIGVVLPPNMNYTINISIGMIYASNGNTFYIPNGLFSDTYIRYYTNSPWGYKVSFNKDLDEVIIFVKDRMKYGGSTTKLADGSSIPDTKPTEQPQTGEPSTSDTKPIEQPQTGEPSTSDTKPIEQPQTGEPSELPNQKDQSSKSFLYSLWEKFRMLFLCKNC